jgi:hypothetical protein
VIPIAHGRDRWTGQIDLSACDLFQFGRQAEIVPEQVDDLRAEVDEKVEITGLGVEVVG